MRVLALFLLVLPATAQISSLSTNAVGDEVYFTTYLRPIDSNHGPREKAYRWTTDGISLVADSARFELIERASPALGGDALAISRSTPCNTGDSCISFLQEYSELRTIVRSRDLPGHIEPAPRGPYAQLTRQSGWGPVPSEAFLAQRLQRVRLDDWTAEPEPLGDWPAYAGRWIADDGTMLGAGWRLLAIDGEETPLGPAAPAGQPLPEVAFLAHDASFVAYQLSDVESLGPDSSSGELRLRFRDGSDVSLGVIGRLVDLSKDSSTLLYLSDVDGAPQAFTLSVPGGAERQETREPLGVDAAAINGDASVVFVASGGRLLRISEGRVDALLGPLPDFDRGAVSPPNSYPARSQMSPGSTYRQYGAHLASTVTIAPEPAGDVLDGVSIQVGETSAAILWTSPLEIGFQVPWETPPNGHDHLIVSHRTSGWEAVVFYPFERRLASPATPEMDGVNLAVHQGFDRLVTREDPARPGEYVHVYAAGLGPVSPPVPTGVAAPLDSLSTLTMACDWQTTAGPRFRDRVPADVVFAGLAPGLVGFYQVVWRIPDAMAPGDYRLWCIPGGSVGTYPVGGDVE